MNSCDLEKSAHAVFQDSLPPPPLLNSTEESDTVARGEGWLGALFRPRIERG